MVTEIDVFSHVTESWLALPDDAWLQRAQELGLYMSLYDMRDAITLVQNAFTEACIQARHCKGDWIKPCIVTHEEFQRSRQRLDAICKAWLTISKEWEQ